jgi:hypothetical protein
MVNRSWKKKDYLEERMKLEGNIRRDNAKIFVVCWARTRNTGTDALAHILPASLTKKKLETPASQFQNVKSSTKDTWPSYSSSTSKI